MTQIMFLPNRDKKLFLIFFLLIILITSSTTNIKDFLPDDLKKILYSPTITPADVKGTQTEEVQNRSEYTVIIKIIDGDTVLTKDGNKIRYIGIDSPESQDPRKDFQCFAAEASNRNKELVLGKTVRLEKDVSETDRYGRLLRYIYFDDTLINEQLVLEGFAVASSYPPDIKYQHRLNAAEKIARENMRGLWLLCNN